MSARTRSLALLTSLAVLVGPATAAAAAADSGTGGSEPTPAEEIAESLADSPVYVAPAYDTAFPESERERLAELADQGPLDLYIIAVPLASGDAWDGDPEALISAVADRLGTGPRHVIAYEQSLDGSLTGADFGADNSREAFYGALTSNTIH